MAALCLNFNGKVILLKGSGLIITLRYVHDLPAETMLCVRIKRSFLCNNIPKTLAVLSPLPLLCLNLQKADLPELECFGCTMAAIRILSQ